METIIFIFCLWFGIRKYERIDQLSRRIIGKGLEEE